MNIFLDISDAEIENLAPDKFERLVLKLYQQEFSNADMPHHNEVIGSGKYSAPDEGIDIMVKSIPSYKSCIKHAPTGIQVKATNMPSSRIKGEMCPNGKLRESIKQLIEQKGTYIIACSKEKLSDNKIAERKQAMRETIGQADPNNQLTLDFLDQGKIANWVNSKPTIMLWLRNIASQVKAEYSSYGNWANDPRGVESELLVDEEPSNNLRITLDNKQKSVAEGLSKMREELREPRKCIRLTGLSGAGKTRMAQALFDERIGTDALPKHWAIYADCSEILNPDIYNAAKQLMGYSHTERLVLIVDNCPNDVHHKLVKICEDSNNKNLSLLTIEHDVQEDKPEGTSVYMLGPVGGSAIMQIISENFPQISETNAKVIVKMSDGNFRFAYILSQALIKTEGGMATLDDTYIFERIFWQERQKDSELLEVARVASLVYSFSMDTDKEVGILAELAEITPQKFRARIAELKRRQIIQSRGQWHALLPHALANRLTKEALEYHHTCVDSFTNTDEKRLLTSFAHRLSYLHESEEAIKIVKEWLKNGGYIEKNFDIKIFAYVAATSSEDALAFIERKVSRNGIRSFLQEKNTDYPEYVNRNIVEILWHLAYDKELFERSARLLCELVLLKSSCEHKNNMNNVSLYLQLLFYSYLSGTHAPVDMRIDIVRELFDSGDLDKINLGINLIEGALRTVYIGPSNYEFGSHKRDYGIDYRGNYNRAKEWDAKWINFTTDMALSGKEYAIDVQKFLVKHFRSLCYLTHGEKEIFTSVIDVARKLKKGQYRVDLWLAIYETIRYGSKGMLDSQKAKLKELHEELAPSTPIEKAITVFSKIPLDCKLDNNENHCYKSYQFLQEFKQTKKSVENIGYQIGECESDFDIFLQKVTNIQGYSAPGRELIMILGSGLADGCTNQKQCFDMLRKVLKEKIEEEAPISDAIEQLIKGYLCRLAEINSCLYNEILDELLEDDVLGKTFPIFQLTSAIDERAIERLHKSLELGNISPNAYRSIAPWLCTREQINDDDLAALLEKLLAQEDGLLPIIKILDMRFYEGADNTHKISKSLHTLTRKFLLKYINASNEQKSDQNDYDMEIIWTKYLEQENSEQDILFLVQCLIKMLNDSLSKYSLQHPLSYWSLLDIIAKKYPHIYLDHVIAEIDEFYISIHNLPIDKIPDKTIISWCEQEPEKRYQKIVKLARARLYTEADDNNLIWRPIVDKIIKNTSNNLSSILEELGHTVLGLYSGFIVDNLVDVYKKHFSLIDALSKYNDKTIIEWQEQIRRKLEEAIDWENQRNRRRDENSGFE